MTTRADKEAFGAACAEAIATNSIPDELREEAAKLLIGDLRATPELRITCMCGQCINMTATELADNLQAKGSEYENYTGNLISAYATGHTLNIKKSTKKGVFQALRERISN